MSITITEVRDAASLQADNTRMDVEINHPDYKWIPYTLAERDNILDTVVDPLVSNPLRWADLTSDKQAEWSQYRTDLLNVPQQAGFPNSITWPTEPN